MANRIFEKILKKKKINENCYISPWGLLSCLLLVVPSVLLFLFIEFNWLLIYFPSNLVCSYLTDIIVEFGGVAWPATHATMCFRNSIICGTKLMS